MKRTPPISPDRPRIRRRIIERLALFYATLRARLGAASHHADWLAIVDGSAWLPRDPDLELLPGVSLNAFLAFHQPVLEHSDAPLLYDYVVRGFRYGRQSSASGIERWRPLVEETSADGHESVLQLASLAVRGTGIDAGFVLYVMQGITSNRFADRSAAVPGYLWLHNIDEITREVLRYLFGWRSSHARLPWATAGEDHEHLWWATPIVWHAYRTAYMFALYDVEVMMKLGWEAFPHIVQRAFRKVIEDSREPYAQLVFYPASTTGPLPGGLRGGVFRLLDAFGRDANSLWTAVVQHLRSIGNSDFTDGSDVLAVAIDEFHDAMMDLELSGELALEGRKVALAHLVDVCRVMCRPILLAPAAFARLFVYETETPGGVLLDDLVDLVEIAPTFVAFPDGSALWVPTRRREWTEEEPVLAEFEARARARREIGLAARCVNCGSKMAAFATRLYFYCSRTCHEAYYY
jgi:hypothetical protein